MRNKVMSHTPRQFWLHSQANNHFSRISHKLRPQQQVRPNYSCCLFMLRCKCRSTEDFKCHMEAPWCLSLQPVLIRSDSVFRLTVSLNPTPSLHRVLLLIGSKLSDSNSLMHGIPYSINLTVSVYEFNKICLFVNIIFAVSLHFIKLTLIYGTCDYKVVLSFRSSEVTHSACVCIFIRYILYRI